MTETQNHDTNTHITYRNPWNAFENTPEAADIKLIKARVILALRRHIENQGWNQTQAAYALGVKQIRISDLLNGQLNKFSVDKLVKMAIHAGLPVEISVAGVSTTANKASADDLPSPVSLSCDRCRCSSKKRTEFEPVPCCSVVFAGPFACRAVGPCASTGSRDNTAESVDGCGEDVVDAGVGNSSLGEAGRCNL